MNCIAREIYVNGPVTAKLCKSAKGARDAEMGLHPTQERIW